MTVTFDTSPTFDDFVSPVQSDEFLRNVFGKEPLHIRSSSGRLQHLLSWNSLNEILFRHRLEGLHLRLLKNDSTVPSEMYTERVTSEFLGEYDQLSVRRLTELFREGATLVLNHFRNLHRPVGLLADMLELVFSSYVETVVFAGWHSTQAVETHWDIEDTFIVQVIGRKRWRLLQPTRRHPLEKYKTLKLEPPNVAHWEGDLLPGDVLHIPRGWWHDAKPYEEPTLHITFAVRPPTGLDLARNLLSRLTDLEELRANLPRYATESEQKNYMEAFRKSLDTEAKRMTLRNFFSELDSSAPGKARLSLPWSAVPKARALPDTVVLSWRPPRSAIIHDVGDTIKIRALGADFTFPNCFKRILHLVMERRSITVGKIRELHEGSEAESIVLELVASGLIIALEFDS